MFVYDRYGNRRFDEAGTTTLGSCPAAQCNPQIDQLTNRFATGQGYVYDESGSLIQDAAGRRYVYDGESKQTEVRDAANNVIGRYFYDGDGRRVKKIVPATAETTIFVYDASGRLVAEYSTIVANSADAKVAYLTNDHLGSPRINTDANGNVTARHDYHPFGEEIGTLAVVPGSPQPRTTALGYTTDTIRQKFTGYERDDETDLDFAEARMYESRLGRFSTTDPSRKSIIAAKPQSWHRYNYCFNNPLILVDKNGKWPTKTHNKLIEVAFKGLSPGNITMIKAGSYKTDTSSDGKPISTLWPSEAHKHAMTQEGLSPEQAWNKAWDFLKAKLKEVREAQRDWEGRGGTGLSGVALMALGEATHVYEDATSPAHGFDKTYGIPQKIVIVSWFGVPFPLQVPDLDKWRQELDEHAAQESGDPTPEQIATSALYSRAFFLVAFGEDKFGQLEMSDDERKSVRELADRFRSQIGVK